MKIYQLPPYFLIVSFLEIQFHVMLVEIFFPNSLNFRIFRDLIVLLRYFSRPIFSFLVDEDILTSSLFSNGNFARSSITGDVGIVC